VAARAQENRRRFLRRLALWGGGFVVLAALVGWAALPEIRAMRHPARAVPSMGGINLHTATEGFAYNSRPPTSGPHAPQPPRWGRSNEPIPETVQVHGLEHGGILVQYRCPEPCPELVDRLDRVVRRYSSKVLLAPNMNQDSLIALTSWTRLQELEDFDEPTIVDFIETFRNRGPEKTTD
jgi:hypothetical protein